MVVNCRNSRRVREGRLMRIMVREAGRVLLIAVWELDVEFEEEDVAVFDDVLFAFGAEEAGFFDGLLAAVFEEVGGGVAVGLDETLFEVGVDDACGAGGLGAAANGPGANLLYACGEVGDEVEQRVGGVDEAVEAGLLEAE